MDFSTIVLNSEGQHRRTEYNEDRARTARAHATPDWAIYGCFCPMITADSQNVAGTLSPGHEPASRGLLARRRSCWARWLVLSCGRGARVLRASSSSAGCAARLGSATAWHSVESFGGSESRRVGAGRTFSRRYTVGHGWSRQVTMGHGWSRRVTADHGMLVTAGHGGPRLVPLQRGGARDDGAARRRHVAGRARSGACPSGQPTHPPARHLVGGGPLGATPRAGG